MSNLMLNETKILAYGDGTSFSFCADEPLKSGIENRVYRIIT